MNKHEAGTWRAATRRLTFRLLLASGLSCLLAPTAGATPPVLYAQAGLQSPVRADPDDLLFLAGQGLAATDTVVYRALADTSLPLGTASSVPATNTAAQGIAFRASTVGAPTSLTVRLPTAMTAGQSYGLWVRNAQGEWSNGIRINDARPQWISPARVYATATAPGVGRYLKVVGRNLQPASGFTTRVRLRGPATYQLNARDDGNPATAYEAYVAQIDLPASLQPGDYAVEVSRDGVSWMSLAGQMLKVLADPGAPAQFPVSSYGNCFPNDDSDDSNCVVAAIAAATAAGGGEVTFPGGTWTLINGAERAGVETNNGIVVPAGVSLVGTGAAAPAVISRNPCWRRPVWFSLLGRNTVRDLTFRDEGTGDGVLCNAKAPVQAAVLQIGKVWYTATVPMPTLIEDVTISRNVFDKPFRAIVSGGVPSARLQITSNVFGAWLVAIFMNGDKANIKTPFTIDDAIITRNRFLPGSYLDVAAAQGTMATTLGSAQRLDFSENQADGAATDYLNAPGDAKGWRAGFFWHLSGPQEQLLLAKNTATCTGDKAGDGEAFAYDNNHNNFALDSAQTVTAASANGATLPGPLRTVLEGQDISPMLATYYVGHWLRIVQGPGLGQSRRIAGYAIDPVTGLVSFTVAPAWDVPPVPGQSRVNITRQFWQAYLVDNVVDHRQPLCQKSNANGPNGGSISLWAQSSDSTVENNTLYDTDGIVLPQTYSVAGDPACPTCTTFSFFQGALEIRGNLVDGEYDWNSPCSLSGFRGLTSSSPTPSSLPPVTSFGNSISHNTFRHLDGLRSGALELALGSWGGPAPGNWRLVDNTLIHHNLIADVTGSPPVGNCGGMNHYGQQRSAINLDSPVIWRSVLYANTCTNNANRLQDKGTATVRVCPAGPTANSCECTTAVVDLSLSAVIDKVAAAGNPTLRYTVVVTNIGTVTANNVLLFADVLPGVSVTALTSSLGSCQDNVDTCAIGALAAGASATVTLTAVITVPDPPAVTFGATTSSGDANMVNNSTRLRAQLTPQNTRVPLFHPIVEAGLGLGLAALARRRWQRRTRAPRA